MPENKTIVINTSPLISLVAAWDTLEPLSQLYSNVHVPFEVCQEIQQGGQRNFAVSEFVADTFLSKSNTPLNISPFLQHSLDQGEAAVIQLALDQDIGTVCIDETIGRRIARLNNLKLTGSMGILIRYKQEIDTAFSLQQAIKRMQNQGIRLGTRLIEAALQYD